MPKKRPDYWKSPAILSFLRKSEEIDPEAAIKIEANKLLLAANMAVPPFNPKQVAHLRKVISIKYSNSTSTSRIVPVQGGFTVAVKPAAGSRDVFSLAHEIGHTFFYDIESLTPTRLQRDLGGNAEEKLCDIFAAELLMPEQRFKEDALAIFNRLSTWCETLFQLRSLYKVSMRAVAERIVELGLLSGSVIIRWSWKSKPNDEKDTKLRVDWSVPLKDGKHYFVWPQKPASEDTPFFRASTNKRLIREESKLNLGTFKGNYLVEAKGYHNEQGDETQQVNNTPASVLSIIFPNIE